MDRGEAVPHFTLTDRDGVRTSYASSIWQQKQLVLVLLGSERSSEADDYAARLHRAFADADGDTALIVTNESLAELSGPAALVADRWGEVVHVARAARPNGLPPPEDLAAWAEHVRQRCPECEGESR